MIRFTNPDPSNLIIIPAKSRVSLAKRIRRFPIKNQTTKYTITMTTTLTRANLSTTVPTRVNPAMKALTNLVTISILRRKKGKRRITGSWPHGSDCGRSFGARGCLPSPPEHWFQPARCRVGIPRRESLGSRLLRRGERRGVATQRCRRMSVLCRHCGRSRRCAALAPDG